VELLSSCTAVLRIEFGFPAPKGISFNLEPALDRARTQHFENRYRRVEAFDLVGYEEEIGSRSLRASTPPI
jgi:hypothetical protein